MRALSVITLSLLLVVTNVVSASTVWLTVPNQSPGKDCTCGKSCCIKQPVAPIPAQPVTPPDNSGRETQLPLALVAAALLLQHHTFSFDLPPSVSSPPPQRCSVPLYDWNCSYVI